MLKKILLGVVALVLVFVGVVAMQPATYTVSRSIGIATPHRLCSRWSYPSEITRLGSSPQRRRESEKKLAADPRGSR